MFKQQQGERILFIWVYYGEDNLLNTAQSVLPFPGERHTSQLAELTACHYALMDFMNVQEELQEEKEFDHPLGGYVIKSDSEYVVRGVTEWLPKWKRNGWRNSRGQPIANERLWRQIDDLLQNAQEKTEFQFWLVPRAYNEAADELAQKAVELHNYVDED